MSKLRTNKSVSRENSKIDNMIKNFFEEKDQNFEVFLVDTNNKITDLKTNAKKEINIINTKYAIDEKIESTGKNINLGIEKATETAEDIFNVVKDSSIDAYNIAKDIGSAIYNKAKDVVNDVKTGTKKIINNINTAEKIEKANINSLLENVEKDGALVGGFSYVGTMFRDAFDGEDFAFNNITNSASDMFSSISAYLDESNLNGAEEDGLDQKNKRRFIASMSGIASIIADNLKDYQDGVSETTFGVKMEETWYGSNTKAFLNYFKDQNSKTASESRQKINILQSTPLDSGDTRNALYGSLMLGAPFLFNKFSDPTNRTLINSLIKDGRFVSFTPGLPKFNGTSYTADPKNNILLQTPTPTSMLEYLTKNGIDGAFADKDKRYYTFKTDYKDYFAYLETMLNVVWIKMGLAKNGETFNLFSFFDIKAPNSAGGINPENYEKLLEKYNSSIGFFINPNGSVTEAISNNNSSDGDQLASKANQNAQDYQAINYITGMGTGGSIQNATRKIGVGIRSVQQLGSTLGEHLGGTIEAIQGVDSLSGNGGGVTGLAKTIMQVAKIPIALASDIVTFNNTNDLGAIMQSFATSNGMMVRYPNLWADSQYSKGINLNFEFTSPYGDPLSIFKYVYVPFFALLAFGMPRQAAENGLVSPFLVRCDIPGLVTSDLALISDITWTKGGSNNLWTKDGLPRAITVSVTVQDLYPYLAMSKRISFLSANPSYAIFLDNMSGMLALNDTNEEDGLNTYFKEMINRINGEERNGKSMWNKFNSSKSQAIRKMSDSVRSSISATVDPSAIPWLHNSSVSGSAGGSASSRANPTVSSLMYNSYI